MTEKWTFFFGGCKSRSAFGRGQLGLTVPGDKRKYFPRWEVRQVMMSFDYVTETIYFQLKKQKFHTYFDSTPIFIYRNCNTKFDMEMPNFWFISGIKSGGQ